MLDNIGHISAAGNSPFSRITGGQYSYFLRPVSVSAFRIMAREIKSGSITGNPLKIGVFGCSCGEEPYSLAMQFHRAGMLNNIRIKGIDRDPKAVLAAANAVYPAKELANAEGYADLFERHEKTVKVNKIIRRQVDFQVSDISSKDFSERAGKFKAIVLHNVLYYFSEADKKTVLDNICSCLAPGGILLVNDPISDHRFALDSTDGEVRAYRYSN